MLTVKNVSVATERYGDAYQATVAFQVGPQAYSTVDVKLTPEATREVVELMVAKATAMLTVVPSQIKIAGEPLPTPEFAEVDEVPVPELDERGEAVPVPAFLHDEPAVEAAPAPANTEEEPF